MSTLHELFKNEGEIRTVSGSLPFAIDDPGKVWMTLEGTLDVFVLERRDGQPAGVRDYYFSATPGQGAFGLDGTPYNMLPDAETIFIAVGRPDTIVAWLPLDRIKEIANQPEYIDDVSAFIDSFLNGLSQGLTKDITPSPKGQIVLPAQGEADLAVSDYAGAHKAPVWLQSPGRFLYIGMEEISQSDDTAFPVTEYAWIQALDNETLTCLPTRQMLVSGGVWKGLAAYQQALFNALAFNLRFVSVDAYNTMRARIRSDERARESGLHDLADVLDTRQEKHLSDEAREDALLGACELAAGRLGIAIIPPLKSKSDQGTKPTVEDVASSSRIRIRKVALREKWWKFDAGPMVAHIDEGRQPVALLPTPGNRYEIHNPAGEPVTVVTEETAKEISDFAYYFYPYLPERPVSAKELFSFGLKSCRRDLRMLGALGLIVGLLGMIPPMIMASVFNDIIPYADRSRLLQMTCILLTCSVGVAGLEYVRNLASLRIATRLHGGIESAVMDRILRMPLTFFRRQTAGDLAERALGVTRVREVVSGPLIAAILNGAFAFTSLGLLFYYHSSLAWWVLVGLAVYLGVLTGTWCVQLHYRRQLADVEGKLSGKVLQFITGIPKLRAGGGEGRAFSIWAKQFGIQRSLAYKAGIADKWLVTFNSVFLVLASMGVFLGVVYFMGQDLKMDTGSFIAFNAAFGNVLMGMMSITMSMTMLINTWPYAERIMPIVQQAPESGMERTDPGELTGRIEITGVSFRYHDDTPIVLKNISLRIQPGEFVALAGHSGSGKSTLLRLLLGFESPTTGSIYYDDMDLSDLDPSKVRHNMGVVIQNSSVMPGDIFTNIIGTRQLTMEDAWEAATAVSLAKDIKAMPMGMHTVVTEGGSTLSGGQKQRMVIARALVNRPRILFLDEATSALDNRNQAIVSESLEKVKATRIVVAHRLSTIKNADRIIVMDKGEIGEIGTYEELMEKEGLFHDLVKRQLL